MQKPLGLRSCAEVNSKETLAWNLVPVPALETPRSSFTLGFRCLAIGIGDRWVAASGFDRISLLVHHRGSVPVHHTSFFVKKCNRLKARVVIYANQ
jgi:hypothetical protein